MSDKPKKIDTKPIKDLAKILESLNLSRITYTEGDFSVTVAKGSEIQTLQQTQKVVKDTDGSTEKVLDFKNDPRAIKSPMVGTVYLQPEPGANKFVNIGDNVKSGQTLLIIEAMKTMNPIESNLQGKVIVELERIELSYFIALQKASTIIGCLM